MWTLLSGSLANAFGNGVVFPYLLIYLHNVRGIGLGTAGLVLAASSVAALIGGPVSGTLIDHFGPRRVLAACMVVSGIGFGVFAFVHSVGTALVAAVLAGVGNGAFWPSHASMVATLTERGFAFQLGGAAGRAIGGFALATAPHGLWLAAAAAALAGGGFALLLERFIPPALRRTPVAVPV